MKQILVVEDHEDFRSIVNVLLSVIEPAAQIWNAVNGREGVDLAKQYHPDLILLDMQMPIMDGYETAMALRQEVQTRDIPLVIMTSARDAGPTLVQLSAVCQGMLTKPFSLDELTAVIQSLKMPA